MWLAVNKYLFTVFLQQYPSNSLVPLFTGRISTCRDEANQFPLLSPRAADVEYQRCFKAWHGPLEGTGGSTAFGSPTVSTVLWSLLELERFFGVCNIQVPSTFSCHLNQPCCPCGFSTPCSPCKQEHRLLLVSVVVDLGRACSQIAMFYSLCRFPSLLFVCLALSDV